MEEVEVRVNPLVDWAVIDTSPVVPPVVALLYTMTLEAVQAVVDTDTVPEPLIAADTPQEAFEPTAIASLLPAVPRTKFPFEAVTAPNVAVRVVLAVREPVTFVVPVKPIPPDPALMATEVAPVVLPNVFTEAPVVASVVAPVDVRVEKDPDPLEASSRFQVSTPPDLDARM